jgi:uncharacterized protein YkwD
MFSLAGAPPLKWDRKLYGAAAEWARKCRFQHSYNGNGENLGWNYGNWKQVVDAWYNEVRLLSTWQNSIGWEASLQTVQVHA